MTVTHAAVLAGFFSKSWNVTSSADGDLTDTITHGFVKNANNAKVTPTMVWLVPLQPQAYTHKWVLGTVDNTTIIINASSVSGGGLAGTPQLQVIAMMPQSIID